MFRSAEPEWNGFISAPRLDDLQCAFGALTAFLGADDSGSAKVFCLFDNEEVGSRTKAGGCIDISHRCAYANSSEYRR